MLAAIRSCSLEEVDACLARGDSVDDPCSFGITPVMVAAYKCGPDILIRLINAGASVNSVSNNGTTVLMYAAIGDSVENVDIVAARTHHLHTRCSEHFNALTHAARNASTRMVERLLELGLSPDPVMYGRSALGFAVASGNLGMTKALVEAGASLNAKNCEWSLASVVVSKGHLDIAQYLAEKGVPMHGVYVSEYNPNGAEMCDLLGPYGANVSFTDRRYAPITAARSEIEKAVERSGEGGRDVASICGSYITGLRELPK